MHIGFVTSEYITSSSLAGGLAAYVKKTASLLADRDHKVVVFYLSSRNMQWQDGNVTIHEIQRLTAPPLLAQGISPFGRLNLIRKLSEQMLSTQRLAEVVRAYHTRQPLDILHMPNYQTPGYHLRNNNLIPVVCRISSYTPLWRTLNDQPSTFYIRMMEHFEIQQLQSADGIFAPSKLLAEVHQRAHKLHVDVLPTPIDMLPQEQWDYAFYNSKLSNRQYLLFAGSLMKVKGADLIGIIGRQLLDSYPDLHLVMLGTDYQYPGKKVRMLDYIAEHIGADKAKFIYSSPIPKAQLYPIYANAVGVLMPSRIDNYPNVCLEAQSVGVPVVGTYQSSLDEMIVEGETGFLADNNDPDSFLAAVHRLMAMDNSQRENMIMQIKALTQRRVDDDPITQLEQYYLGIVAEFNV